MLTWRQCLSSGQERQGNCVSYSNQGNRNTTQTQQDTESWGQEGGGHIPLEPV